MVIKFKVSDVAKDFGKNNKDIINILSEYCDGPAKKANTVLEENELNILFDKLTADNSVESWGRVIILPDRCLKTSFGSVI